MGPARGRGSMVVPSPGAVILVRFPFSDLSATKFRPAVVIAWAGCEDWILAQVTSNPYADKDAVRLDYGSFATGGLRHGSFVRPGKLFTADATLMVETAGLLHRPAFAQVVKAVVKIIQHGA
ncbi:MAG: MazF family transcriptional regulator [Candidatus Hydrogenedentes bacterium]|nr:MazF family transcriptional regulator [Candidatus Hydrogenedentota bacterium]